MSDTIVDMPKVTQMLDAGWCITIFKGKMGSYEVRAIHKKPDRMESTKKLLVEKMTANKDFMATTTDTPEEVVEMFDFDDDHLMTDDWTPEQALTRMAYKTFGEIL